MILRIDTSSPVPPYEQIRSQITTMVATGVLPEGARLPSIRQLAKDLGLAGGTVARAYRELEVGGLIATRGRHGTFVTGVKERSTEQNSNELIEGAAREFAVRVRQLGVQPNEALGYVRQALRQVAP